MKANMESVNTMKLVIDKSVYETCVIKVKKFHLGDCTLDGLSSKYDELIVVKGADKDLELLKKNPSFNNVLIYVERELWGERYDYLKPLHDKYGCLSAMSGGNFAIFDNGMEIKIHDRYETQEQYNRLCE